MEKNIKEYFKKFYNMKPYESWTWNSEIKDWRAPVEMPTDRIVKWNETDQQWEDF